MDIKTFFDQSAGKWFAQRTTYKLSESEPENSKSEVTLTLLPADDDTVIKLCEQHSIAATASTFGIHSSWDNSVDWGKPKQVGSTLIVIVPNSDNPNSGQLLRQTQLGDKLPATGHCIVNEDDSVTLVVQDDAITSEERLWFASENLRLRTTLLKHSEGVYQTAFYSEIRKIAPKPQE